MELHALASGLDVSQNDLVRIQSIKPTGDTYYFPPPQVTPHGFPGVRQSRFDDLDFLAGFPYVEWLFSVLTYVQYMYLRNTYCSGGFSGLVTIYTTISGTDFVRRNAVMKIPETGVIPEAFYAPRPVSVKMKRLKVPA